MIFRFFIYVHMIFLDYLRFSIFIDSEEFGEARRNFATLCETLRNFAKRCETLRHFAKPSETRVETLRNLAKPCETWRNIAKLSETTENQILHMKSLLFIFLIHNVNLC